MIGCIIQARMGSSRLPGKVMKLIDDKNPILYYVIKQLEHSKLIDKLVVATSTLPEDDIIDNYVKKIGIECFRGSEKDVLDRHYQCAKKFSFEIIVRIPSDKPLIDPEIVDNVIKKFTSDHYDYVTNFLPYSFPYGTEVEVFSFNALESTWKNSKLPSEREHVTPYIYKNKKNFRIFNLTNSKDLSKYRWEVDRENDLKLVRMIVAKIMDRPILTKNIIDLFSKEPNLIKINQTDIPDEGYIKSLKEDKEFRETKNHTL